MNNQSTPSKESPVKRFIPGIQSGEKPLLSLFSIIVLTALMIIPLRGGLQLAPLNQSSVYFSHDNFANMAAINAPWNMLYALNHSAEKENPFKVSEEKMATLVVDSLFHSGGHSERFIDLQKNPRPNIIVIAWESLTSKVIGM